MDINEELRKIDAVAVEVLDLGARADAKRTAGSQRDAYGKALREVRAVAGDEEALALADWIRSSLREREAFPSARDVRQKGAAVCRENGHSISTGSWLGA